MINFERFFQQVSGVVRTSFDRPYKTVVVHQYLPPKLKKKVLYVVEEDGFEEQAALLCPCGCKRTIHLNLLTDERPCWSVNIHKDRTASVHPSVWRTKECRSHFWLKDGRVVWCKDEGSVRN